MELKKILIDANKVKFGREWDARKDRETFFDGIRFALLRIEGGKEALEERGISTTEL